MSGIEGRGEGRPLTIPQVLPFFCSASLGLSMRLFDGKREYGLGPAKERSLTSFISFLAAGPNLTPDEPIRHQDWEKE